MASRILTDADIQSFDNEQQGKALAENKEGNPSPILTDADISDFDKSPKKPTLGSVMKDTADMLAGGFKRAASEGPAGFRNITGGPGQAFASGVKTEAIKRSGLAKKLSFGGVIPEELVAESLSSASDPQNMMGGLFKNPGAANITLYKKVTGKLSPLELDSFIEDSINKGIRPSVSGKASPALFHKFMGQAKDAVKTIIENKGVLNIKDEFGEATGRLPKNLNEFSQAIDQVKSAIFKQYDQEARTAGRAGAMVNLENVASSIEREVSNKAIRTMYPKLADETIDIAQRLREAGTFTTDEAQTAIGMLNASLKAFYKNLNPQAAAKVVVDASIATKLRNALDESINNLGGEYRPLKQKYGSLRAIQDDVVKRAIVDARKNYKGFFDLGEIFSAGDIAKGLMTLNPAEIAKGTAQRTLISYFKYLNNPNRIVKQMFTVADRAYKPTLRTREPFVPAGLIEAPAVPLPEPVKALPPPDRPGRFGPEGGFTPSDLVRSRASKQLPAPAIYMPEFPGGRKQLPAPEGVNEAWLQKQFAGEMLRRRKSAASVYPHGHLKQAEKDLEAILGRKKNRAFKNRS